MTLLATKMVEKPWGRDVLPPQFAVPQGRRIGEVWFEPPAELPEILVKYIFTSENLSVQVHPDDAQAAALGESDRGKEECWLVIDAEPEAVLGIGFKQSLDVETMRAAALDGSIVDLMKWFPVKSGDFFYIPAGTVHAIGAGVSLIEIQQTSDVTYRLFDYGRPRELHLDKALCVARGEPYSGSTHISWPEHDVAALVRCRSFSADVVAGPISPQNRHIMAGPCLVIPIIGEMVVEGEVIGVGGAAVAQGIEDVSIEQDQRCIIVRKSD